MRNSFAAREGARLLKTPSPRRRAGRRRLAAVCGVLALALASGLIGSLTAGGQDPRSPETGPFSYFPHQ
ncbi:hypothetical protein [Phenylobacterium sp.]|uniref:hypothetical protein n=1 Tax=Phenylobacterium sp. TaxID=1871053 RepID=UPI00391B5F93